MSEISPRLKVMLVDDHHVVRTALRALLEQHGCEIVAEADSADAALKNVVRARPQIILMDLEMPGTDGITATRHIRRVAPDAKVILLSAHDEEKDVVEALTEAGAASYLLKSDAPEELLSALRAVSSGKRYLSPSVAPLLLMRVSNPKRSDGGGPVLTTREREVLRLVSQGRPAKRSLNGSGLVPKPRRLIAIISSRNSAYIPPPNWSVTPSSTR